MRENDTLKTSLVQGTNSITEFELKKTYKSVFNADYILLSTETRRFFENIDLCAARQCLSEKIQFSTKEKSLPY